MKEREISFKPVYSYYNINMLIQTTNKKDFFLWKNYHKIQKKKNNKKIKIFNMLANERFQNGFLEEKPTKIILIKKPKIPNFIKHLTRICN